MRRIFLAAALFLLSALPAGAQNLVCGSLSSPCQFWAAIDPSSGSANAQIVNTISGGFQLNAGNTIVFVPGFSNTAPMTINVDSTGNLPVHFLGSSLPSGTLISGVGTQLVFNGTGFDLPVVGLTGGTGVFSSITVSGLSTFNGGGFGDISGASATATGATTSRTFAAHFADFVMGADYGMKCDGSTDDTAALQAAINVAQQTAAHSLKKPDGICLTSSTLNITGALTIFGSGNAAVTGSIIRASNLSTNIFNVNTIYPVQFDNFRIETTGGTATAGAGIFISNSGVNTDTKVTRMEFQGVWDGVSSQTAAGFVIDKSRFFNFANDGIHIMGSSTCQDGCGADGSRTAITDDGFIITGSAHANAGIEINAGGDISIKGIKTFQADYGILLALNWGPTGTLLVGMSSLEEAKIASIGITQATSGKEYANIGIVNNQFSNYVNMPTHGHFYVATGTPNTEAKWVRDIDFSHNHINSSINTSISLVQLNDGEKTTVADLTIDNGGAANATGIGCGAGATNVSLENNVGEQLSALYGTLSCSPYIVDNNAYAPLLKSGGTATGSIAATQFSVSNNTNTPFESTNSIDGLWYWGAIAHASTPVGGFQICLSGIGCPMQIDVSLNETHAGKGTYPNLNDSGLTASFPICTDSSKNLTSTCTGLITAANISGGITNNIPYQTGAGATSFLAPVNSAVLVTNGSGVPSESTTLPSGLAASNLTLTTPLLGTPQSGVLTNVTGLPISTGLSGTGAGVLTALGNAVNGSGGLAPVASPILTGTVTGPDSSTWGSGGISGIAGLNVPTLNTTLLGTSTLLSINGQGVGLQVAGTSALGNIASGRFTADSNPANYNCLKSRNTIPGSHTIVNSGDSLCQFNFIGDDGVNYSTKAASIIVTAQGTPAAGRMPGQINIQTASASGVLTNAIIFTSDQNVQVPNLTASTALCADGSKNLSSSCSGIVPLPNLSGTSASLGGSALLAGQCSTNTTTVTGATTSMVALADPVTDPGDGAYWDAFVSAANTVKTKVCATIALTPTASAYNLRVIQ